MCLSFADEKIIKAGVGSRVLFGTALRVRCARCSSGARARDVAARGCASGRAWIDRGGSSLVCREVNGRARSVIRAELDRHARLTSRSPPRLFAAIWKESWWSRKNREIWARKDAGV